MQKTTHKSNSKGFTIIEVLIVLAIAGLIMVVVFLAVPALQRSGRNNALNTSANNIFTGVSNFVSNNNGSLPDAATLDTATNTVSIEGIAGSNTETVKVDTSITSVSAVAKDSDTTLTAASDVGNAEILTGTYAKCNDTASGTVAEGTGRSIALVYIAESSTSGQNIVKCLN